MTLPSASAHAGMVLASRYQLEGPIASGGMAQVWRGLDTALSRPVAVKILHPHLAGDQAFVTRFRREAVAAARLSHPSIVAIYDTISESGVEAIVMELIVGRTLRDALDEAQVLPPSDVINVGLQVSEALGIAHGAGIVHRDVKPANIMVGEARRVLVTDFGIAKANKDDDLTHTGTLLGTAKYLAPEQVAGDPVDPRADLYALGVVLFECATGSVPFDAGADAATALARLQNDAPRARERKPDLPIGLDEVIAKALSRNPADRFDRASTMQAALAAIDLNNVAGPPTSPPARPAASSPSTGTPPPPTTPPPPPTAPVNKPNDAAPVAAPSGTSIMPREALSAPVGPPPATSRRTAKRQANRNRKAQKANQKAERKEQKRQSRRGFGRRLRRLARYAGAAGVVLIVVLALVNLLSNPGTRIPIADATPFDPEAVGNPPSYQEINWESEHAIDGDPNQFWYTEGYGSESLSGFKNGVGLVLDLETSRTINQLALDTASDGWTVEVYANDSGSFGANGDDFDPEAHRKVGEATGNSGTTNISLASGTRNRYLLLWITRVGESPDQGPWTRDWPYRFVLNEVEAFGE